MNYIEIQVPTPALFALFESDSISVGMTHPIPGGGTLRLGEMPIQTRTYGLTPLVHVAVFLGKVGGAISINLAASYIYDKLKSRKVPRVLISGLEVEVTPDGILRAIAEKVEIEGGSGVLSIGRSTVSKERIAEIDARIEVLDQLLSEYVQPTSADNPREITSGELQYWADRREERRQLQEERDELDSESVA